jgi:hypothetical protein
MLGNKGGVTFQFSEQSGATHFRPEINTPTELPKLLKVMLNAFACQQVRCTSED